METENDKTPRFADIMLDPWFKRSFQELRDSPELLRLTLNALIPERSIESLTYTPQESTNQNPDGKGVRIDVECVDKDGSRFVVEIQRAWQRDFFDRAVYNSTFAIQRQLKSGDYQFKFQPVYFIGIVRFKLHKDEEYLHRYAVRDSQGNLMTDDLHYIYLETEKCRGDSTASTVEKFGYVLHNIGKMDSRPDGFAGELFDLFCCFLRWNCLNLPPKRKSNTKTI